MNGDMFVCSPGLSLNRAPIPGNRKSKKLNGMDNIGTGLENFKLSIQGEQASRILFV